MEYATERPTAQGASGQEATRAAGVTTETAPIGQTEEAEARGHVAGPREPAATRRLSEEELDLQPTVERQAWIKEDDYWARTTYIAATGRQTAKRPATQPLPRPERFHRPSRVRSGLTLALLVALVILIPMGVVTAQRAAATHIHLPTSIPGISQPTTAPTVSPTIAPTKTKTPAKK